MPDTPSPEERLLFGVENPNEVIDWAKSIAAVPDAGAQAAALCRLAARLWVRVGGDSKNFRQMAESHGRVEEAERARILRTIRRAHAEAVSETSDGQSEDEDQGDDEGDA